MLTIEHEEKGRPFTFSDGTEKWFHNPTQAASETRPKEDYFTASRDNWETENAEDEKRKQKSFRKSTINCAVPICSEFVGKEQQLSQQNSLWSGQSMAGISYCPFWGYFLFPYHKFLD